VIPALSYHFGLTPDDVWGMSVSQFGQYIRALRELQESMNGQ
jgi:hypothetical protein